MKYIRTQRHQDSVNNIAVEIIPEFDPIFPDVPITERYSAEFLRECVAVDDNVEVGIGWVYNASDGDGGTFTKPDDNASGGGDTQPEQPNPPDSSAIVQEIIDMLEGRA